MIQYTNTNKTIKSNDSLTKRLMHLVFGRRNVAIKMRFNLFLQRCGLSVVAMVLALLAALSINGLVGSVAGLSDSFELLAQRRNEVAGVITLFVSGALFLWSQTLPARK